MTPRARSAIARSCPSARRLAVEGVDALHPPAFVVDRHRHRQPGDRLHAAQGLVAQEPGGVPGEEDAADLGGPDQHRGLDRVARVHPDHQPLREPGARGQRGNHSGASGQPHLARQLTSGTFVGTYATRVPLVGWAGGADGEHQRCGEDREESAAGSATGHPRG